MSNAFKEAENKAINGNLDCDISELFPKGLPRQCHHCGTWGRYENQSGGTCFTVSCKSCHSDFEVVVKMMNSRK